MRRLLVVVLALLCVQSAAAGYAADRHFATRSGMHFFAGAEVEVTGPAETVFAVGGTINARAADLGEVIAAGGTIALRDVMTNRIIAAGGDVHIDGTVTRSVVATGGDVTIAQGTTIGGDAVLTGGDISAVADIGGDLVANGGTIVIGGRIAGDVTARGGRISLQPGTVIAGNLRYHSRRGFDLPANVSIGGAVVQVPEDEADSWRFGPHFDLIPDILGGGLAVGAFIAVLIFGLLFGFGILLVLAALVLAVFGRSIDSAAFLITDQPLRSFGLGMLLCIALPVIAVVLMITIIGIPVGVLVLIGGGLFVGMGGVVAAYWIGAKVRRAISREPDGGTHPGYLRALGWTLIGIVLFCLAGVVPFVGNLAQFFGLITGFGALVLALLNKSIPLDDRTSSAR